MTPEDRCRIADQAIARWRAKRIPETTSWLDVTMNVLLAVAIPLMFVLLAWAATETVTFVHQ